MLAGGPDAAARQDWCPYAGLPDASSFHALAKGADGTDGSRAVSLDI